MSPPNKGKGAAIAFLLAHVGHQDDACVIWPFCRQRGYPVLSVDGKHFKAHRYICELVNGHPPTPDHEAAHSCGNGDGGCINPRHLSWKTREGNQRDRKRHGTAGRKGEKIYKLTPERVAEIRALEGTRTITALAETFGVTRSTIRQIHLGKIWRIGAPQRRQLTAMEVAEIHSLNGKVSRRVVAAKFGINWRRVKYVQTGGPYSAVPIASETPDRERKP